MISDWALMACPDGLMLNWYGPSTMTTRLVSGNTVAITQQTDYPRENRVRLKLALGKAEKFALKLRIPHWSRNTGVKVNGQAVTAVTPGSYFAIDRRWHRADTVEIAFDFSHHIWVGERECAEKVSIYRGPILLTYDRRFNEMDPDQIPPLDATKLNGYLCASSVWMPPILLEAVRATDGRTVRLCDFGSAGVGGSPYRSWLEGKGVIKTEFSQSNPLRTSRVHQG
jgi:hypothetical protein